MDIFHKANTMDWGRVSIVVAAITVFWVGIQSIVPDNHYRVVSTVLQALSSAITLMMRSGKSLIEKAEDNIQTAKSQVVEHVVEQVKKDGVLSVGNQEVAGKNPAGHLGSGAGD